MCLDNEDTQISARNARLRMRERMRFVRVTSYAVTRGQRQMDGCRCTRFDMIPYMQNKLVRNRPEPNPMLARRDRKQQ